MSAYLDRYRGASRFHTEPDLRIFLTGAPSRTRKPLSAVRADIERYVRWLQDVRRFQPSTVSRCLSVVVGQRLPKVVHTSFAEYAVDLRSTAIMQEAAQPSAGSGAARR